MKTVKLNLNLKQVVIWSMLAGSAFAGAVPGAYYQQHHLKAPNEPANPVIVPDNAWNKHFYTTLGIATEWIRGQSISTVSSQFSTGKTKDNFQDNHTAWVPELTLGYHFDNAMLPVVFGSSADVSVTGSGFHSVAHGTPGTGTGYLYAVDGNIIPSESGSPITSNRYQSTLSQYNLSADYTGHWDVSDQFKFSPSVGLAYHNMYENLNNSLLFTSGITNNIPMNSTYQTRTQYAGISIGNGFVYKATSQWQGLLNLRVEALYANSHLTASNVVGSYFSPLNSRVSNTLVKRLTGRGVASVGVGYAFTAAPDAMVLKLTGGVDAWTYAPKVMTTAMLKDDATAQSNPNGMRPTKLVSQNLVNPFVGLELVAPLF